MAKKKCKKLSNAEISFVSIVTKGANGKKFFMSKSAEENSGNENFQMQVKSVATDDVQMLVYGVVTEPLTNDLQDSFMEHAEIEKMAHSFMQKYQLVDQQHNLHAGMGNVVESYIAPVDFTVGTETIVKGSWVLVTKVTDMEVWKKVQNEEYQSYSIWGFAEVEELEADIPDAKVTWVDKVCKVLGIKKEYAKQGENETSETEKVAKDYATEFENFLNNDMWTKLDLLRSAILDAWFDGDTPQEIKDKIQISMQQFQDDIEKMSFVRKSVENTDTSQTEPESTDNSNGEVAKSIENVKKELDEKSTLLNNTLKVVEELQKQLTDTINRVNETTEKVNEAVKRVEKTESDIKELASDTDIAFDNVINAQKMIIGNVGLSKQSVTIDNVGEPKKTTVGKLFVTKIEE